MKALFFFLLSLLPLAAVSQSQTQVIDSLQRRLAKLKGAEKVYTLNELAFQLYQIDAKKAAAYGEQSIRLATTLNDPALLAATKNDASIPLITLGDFKRAIRLNQESLAIRQELKDTLGMISNYSKIAQCYQELTRNEEAAGYYLKTLALLKGKNQPVKEMQIMVNLATVYDNQGQYEQAYQLSADGLKLAELLHHDMSIITAKGTMATVARRLKRYDESIRLFREIIPLCERNHFEDYLTTAYQGIGVTYRAKKDFEQAIFYYKKAYDRYKENGNTYGMGSLALNLGFCYTDLKQYDEAERYFLESEKSMRKAGTYKLLRSLYEGMAELYKQKKDYRKALEYAEQKMRYMDSTYTTEGSTILNDMFVKYQTEKKERQLATEKLRSAEKDKAIARAELKAANERTLNWIIAFIAIIAVILGIVIYRYQRRKRKAALLEVEITRQQEQLRRERELSEQKLTISRELHDNIGSQLTYMISSMDNLTYRVQEDDQLSTRISELSNFGRSTMQELRSTIWAMNAEDGSTGLLFRKLEELRSKIPVELHLHNELPEDVPLQSAEILNLYRIAQEAIQNTLKYAGATVISVYCRTSDDGIELAIADNGTGFDSNAAANGNGLTNMRYRCEQLGAVFTLHSSRETGTRISCTLRHLPY